MPPRAIVQSRDSDLSSASNYLKSAPASTLSSGSTSFSFSAWYPRALARGIVAAAPLSVLSARWYADLGSADMLAAVKFFLPHFNYFDFRESEVQTCTRQVAIRPPPLHDGAEPKARDPCWPRSAQYR